jgi:elongation factor Ts
MNISAKDVMKLRELTGVGMMDAKKALVEVDGDFDQAVEVLRKAGAAKAEKKAERATGQGFITSYIHGEGSLGILLELSCETDFVARNEQFKALAHDLALHIAAMNPLYIDRSDVPEELVAKEREIYTEQMLSEGKPKERIEAIVDGKIEKYFEEIVLLEQPFVKDQGKTVGEVVTAAIQSIGENIRVRRFARFQIAGESNICETK